MSGAGSTWHVAVMRPGEDPIGHLAAAISAPHVLETIDELAETNAVLVEASLRRGSLGLVDAVRHARLPHGHSVLVLVDQFEELFRFRRGRRTDPRNEAVAFVRLLLEATSRRDQPIYVALTMRSDFIGDCMDFPGLPEAVNSGLYLVGRMGRDALRSAITGPVAVGGGRIAPRLVNRVLNDLGDDHDQLPLVQHALMRTWDHWSTHREGDAPIDLADYDAIGGFRQALSMHAEEAYREASALGAGRVAELMFKALTDSYSDPRGVRRPTPIDTLAAICETTEAEVIRVVEVFRQAGRSFLMPPASVTLTSRSIVDLSHESLMRCWTRLIDWAGEEQAAAEFYGRLSRAGTWFAKGSAGLWRDPELQLAEQWRREVRPTAAWAGRYDDGFDQAMAFLDRSLEERARLEAQADRERRMTLRRTQWAAGVLATLLLLAASMAYVAQRERTRAATNLDLARAAVDESLASADRDPAQMAADPPQVEEFRRELLEKAQGFYLAFMNQSPRSEAVRSDLAFARLRMGHINRMLDRPADAEADYRDAIAQFERLAADYDDGAEFRQARANGFNWLGEILRPVVDRAAEAEAAYTAAFALQDALTEDFPDEPQYAEELARTLYNRGILRWNSGSVDASEADFREAIRLLEPLAASRDGARQGLARVLNNLGSVEFTLEDLDEARVLYERAIDAGERLLAASPDNREYRLELAKYNNNLAALLYEQRQHDLAAARSERAVDLMTELARLAPSLAIERADAHNLRGVILQAQDAVAAQREFREALDQFAELNYDGGVLGRPDLHVRFGDFLLNLADFSADGGGAQLLTDAVNLYALVAERIAASGSTSDARNVLDTLSRVLPVLRASDRTRLQPALEQLQLNLDGAATQ